MILLVHMLFGAVIGSIVKNPVIAIFLAFLSHYFLDLIPHKDYSIKNIENRTWNKSGCDVTKVILDLILGITIIYTLNKNTIIFLFAFAAIIPDGLTFLKFIFKNNILDYHYKIHHKIQFLTLNPLIEIPIFLRVFIQIIIVISSILILA